MIAQPDKQADSDQLDINLDVIGIVKRRYPLIMLGILIGTVVAAIYYLQQAPIYESTLTVLVGQRSSELTSTGKGDAEGSNMVQDGILSTHMELFTSRKIINQAITEHQLVLSSASSEGGSPVDRVRSNLTVNKGGAGLAKNASILKATFRDGDPENAVKVLTAVYESYKKYIDSQSKNVGEDAAELIAKAQIKNEEELRQADEEYRKFVQSVPAFITSNSLGSDSLSDIHRVRLNKIEDELAVIRSTLAETRSRYTVIKERTAGKKPEDIKDSEVMALLSEKEVGRIFGLMNVLKDDYQSSTQQLNTVMRTENARTEYQKLVDLQSKKNILLSSFGPNHPSVNAVELEIASVNETLAKRRDNLPEEEKSKRASPAQMLVSYFTVLKNEIAELEKRETELMKLSEIEAKQSKEVELSFLLGGSLKSNLQRAQTRYDEVFKRLQEINLNSDYAGFSTDLLASPLPATSPIWPTKTRIGTLGVLAGAMLGLMFAILAEFADRTFRSPEDVENSVGASILVHIPKIDVAKLKKKVGASKIAPTISTFHAPRGSESETFRVLRTVLLFQAKKAEQNVFMVTSPSPADGKSTTIANLAVSLAQTGKRILLIDADMRRPTVAKTFGIDDVVGLSDILEGESTLDECCVTSEQTNLTICTEGSATSHPSELLESDRFIELVDEVRKKFDIVLIDCPPLLAVADPAIISSVVDGCLLTMRIEKNNRTLVERSCEILRDHDAKLLGVIVNSRKAGRQAYGYTQYNYYGDKAYGYQANYRRYYAAKDPSRETVPRAKPSRNGRSDEKLEARS